jgi:TPR repeat protein
VLQNFIEAVRWFRAAAEQGCVPAMARLGEIYLTGLAPPNVATPAALQSLESGAGSSLLKRLYPEGLAVAQDTEQALKWNRLAAEAGDVAAQGQLGLGLLFAGTYGEEVRDHGRALPWPIARGTRVQSWREGPASSWLGSGVDQTRPPGILGPVISGVPV